GDREPPRDPARVACRLGRIRRAVDRMSSLVVLAPRCPATQTEGRDYDGQMIDGLRARGWAVVGHELEGDFPHPPPAARGDAARVLSAIPDRSTVLIDGLALGAMPDEALREA